MGDTVIVLMIHNALVALINNLGLIFPAITDEACSVVEPDKTRLRMTASWICIEEMHKGWCYIVQQMMV